jgi:hypothetical protein
MQFAVLRVVFGLCVCVCACLRVCVYVCVGCVPACLGSVWVCVFACLRICVIYIWFACAFGLCVVAWLRVCVFACLRVCVCDRVCMSSCCGHFASWAPMGPISEPFGNI